MTGFLEKLRSDGRTNGDWSIYRTNLLCRWVQKEKSKFSSRLNVVNLWTHLNSHHKFFLQKTGTRYHFLDTYMHSLRQISTLRAFLFTFLASYKVYIKNIAPPIEHTYHFFFQMLHHLTYICIGISLCAFNLHSR